MKRLWPAALTFAVLHSANQAHAQFGDPRTYENAPTGTNQIELGYAYARGDASIETSLVVAGAAFDLHQGTVDYTRYFDWFHRLTWVEAAVPMARLGGSVAGTSIRRSIAGAGDSAYAFGMLLTGGPALSEAKFADYTPRTSVGLSFTATAPTGSYDPDRILNLGAGRWSFKPEIGVSHPFGGKWVFDAYANVYVYTDNTAYRGRELLRQQALPGLEGHISYSFNDRVWASLDSRYSFRAATSVDGQSQNNPQENFLMGMETNVSLAAHHALVVALGKAFVHRNGPAVSAVNVRYAYSWAAGEP